jgi:hypothetical protein
VLSSSAMVVVARAQGPFSRFCQYGGAREASRDVSKRRRYKAASE